MDGQSGGKGTVRGL